MPAQMGVVLQLRPEPTHWMRDIHRAIQRPIRRSTGMAEAEVDFDCRTSTSGTKPVCRIDSPLCG